MMKDKNIKGIICQVLFTAAMCLLAIWIGTSGVRKEYKELKEFKKQAEAENLTYCKSCPMCGNTESVKLNPINNSWYIECEEFCSNGARGCDLRTGFYEDKEKLVTDWNNMCNLGN